MRILVLIVVLFLAIPATAQEKEKKTIFKEFYEDFFKYATIYGAGDYKIKNRLAGTYCVWKSIERCINENMELGSMLP